MNEPFDARDEVDGFLARCKPLIPDGFADRLVAAVADPIRRRRHYWQLFAESTRSAFKVAVVFILIAGPIAAFTLHRTGQARPEADPVDQVARALRDGTGFVPEGDGQ